MPEPIANDYAAELDEEAAAPEAKSDQPSEGEPHIEPPSTPGKVAVWTGHRWEMLEPPLSKLGQWNILGQPNHGALRDLIAPLP